MKLMRLLLLVLSFNALQAFSSSHPTELNTCLVMQAGEKYWHWSTEPTADCSEKTSNTGEKLFPSADLIHPLSFISNSEELPENKVCISEKETNNLIVCTSEECQCACFYKDAEGHLISGKVSSINNKDHCLTEAGAQHHYYLAFAKDQTVLASRDWKKHFSAANSTSQGTVSAKTVALGSAMLAVSLNSAFNMIFEWSPLELAIGVSYFFVRFGVSYVGGKIHPRLGGI
ncbi:hypothetical protein [Endozoicomonas numazuensis]|uniref:Thyroglobulin type-1 domain-containing protein n=1 Tax=Endozoicomonas numazuensis TaxID=1137799 RepID=A0A081NI54_9GAMM|nr:hypothetical protein [Endozoicomonas numazuensis]KEQ18127.1 hypothetical protein GZ78_11225 [Endozoicomonas numazuensis]